MAPATADGEELFDHGWLEPASTGYDAKRYDELIRTPMIIRFPDQSLIGTFSAMVQGVDVMPTLPARISSLMPTELKS
jgi:arylsulfatase A-like enzyme